jgi:regulator of protease activity HflC (stomatin/prohibitin superfamily)
MFRRIVVGDNERVLMIRKRRFAGILDPGVYWIFTLGRGLALERHNIRDLIFASEWVATIANQHRDLADRHFTVVETSESQVAVVYVDGKLARVIAPAMRVMYWRGAVTVTFTLIDVRAEAEAPAALLPALARLGRESLVTFAAVDEGKRGLVYLDGRLTRELAAGAYGFWNAVTAPRIEVVEMRRQTVEVPGQEILTRDKVTLRVNISAVYEIANVTMAKQAVKDVEAHLYRTLQVASRQTLGKRTLEEVLSEKADIDETVSAEVRREMEQYGVRMAAIAIKDIILPGDIREILNQVVAAEKQAQANLIRRREETAATRSLLNTAKLMEDNPILVRMKELETLEKIAEKVEKIHVFGGLRGLLES